ncbi:MAG: RSP_7527 family protein [Kiloniellaceae bacterium]
MQHQSQDLSKRPTTGKSGLYIDNVVISADEIERHIAEGKRMQSEAVAAFLTGLFRRLGGAFQRRSGHAGKTAMPHGA